MARRRTFAPLNVFINSRHVGILERAASGAIDFRYDAKWLTWEHRFPISLSLPLRDERYVGQPVFNVFDNLLPDIGRIRQRIAERVGAQGSDVYSLLSALGRDCVGAMEFLPDDMAPGPAGSTQGEPISDTEIGDLIGSLALAPLGLDQGSDFRISIAGAQEKTALLRKEGHWFKPSGTSATTHILKPRIGLLPNGIDLTDSVENEYFCLRLLEAWGLPVAKAEMVDFGHHRTLVVERFDRLWARDGRLLRLPQEDFCQALSIPSAQKYQNDGGPSILQMITLLQGGQQPLKDSLQLLRACFCFWLIGATDGHGKNFSLSLHPGGGYQLTPLYDILSAQPSFEAGLVAKKDFKLALSIGDQRHYRIDDIVPRHFAQTAQQAGVPPRRMQDIMDELADTAEARLITMRGSLPDDFPEKISTSIQQAVSDRLKTFFSSRENRPHFLSRAYQEMGDLAQQQGNHPRSCASYRESLQFLQQNQAPPARDLLLLQGKIAASAAALGEWDQAVRHFHQAHALVASLVISDRDDREALRHLAHIAETIADALAAQGDQGAARDLYRQGLQIANRLLAPSAE